MPVASTTTRNARQKLAITIIAAFSICACTALCVTLAVGSLRARPVAEPFHDAVHLQPRYFPQVQAMCRRGGALALSSSSASSSSFLWQESYAEIHRNILNGSKPLRFFVSVAVEAGIADRLSGMITQLYLAILSKRAFVAITYGDLPSFEAACESPFAVDLMGFSAADDERKQLLMPEEAIAPLKYTYKGERGYTGDRSYDPAKVNTSMYAQLYTINEVPEREWRTSDLSNLPKERPETPFVIGGSNRGRSYAISSENPYHKDWFWKMGLRPESAFMCGLFFLCMPNEEVRRLYQRRYWDVMMMQPLALRIGINVRVGDTVFYDGDEKGEEIENNATARRELLRRHASSYFECAEKIERAFRTLTEQTVIWYVMSDSLALRRAAKAEYGTKVLADLDRKPVHPDCRYHNPDECDRKQVDLAMVHGMGQLFTFSMADYHIVPRESGFGRLGAWMSGRWGNLYELGEGGGDEGGCQVSHPTLPKESAEAWAGV